MNDRDAGRADPGELDALDGLVDDVLAGRFHSTDADVPAEVVASLHRVRELGEEPLPEASRARHLLRIRTHEPAGRRSPGRWRAPRRRLVAFGAAATALLVLGGGGAVAAAQDAQPDDALYGLKRTSEQVWLGIPGGSERVAQVHLTLAARRIHEARQAPAHAERLVAEGLENVEAAAEEQPEQAIENFERLLGDGDDRLPDNASPVARAALHRNCVRIAEKHGLSSEGCGPAPAVDHPGRGHGVGQGRDRTEGPGPARGHDAVGKEGKEKAGPRGWGPGGRPDGAVGPPPGTPGHDRDGEAEADE